MFKTAAPRQLTSEEEQLLKWNEGLEKHQKKTRERLLEELNEYYVRGYSCTQFIQDQKKKLKG